MPHYLTKEFQEFPHGGYLAHRFDFFIDSDSFLAIFSEVDIAAPEYHMFRNEEVGFIIPSCCYDVKFDRLENFEQGNFYALPTRGQSSKSFNFSTRLAQALITIITLHYKTYRAKAYFAVAETHKLKRFYDRVLQQPQHDIGYEIITGLGDGGMGYALKTKYFHD
ncbi:hypothetical protein SC206_16230 [Rouxiella sp. T17]|uniref:hypothetical protein n=1 Tax=Rouxiella sp. T17 TaxID=3085684 RepID=UPI002FCAB342